MHVHAIATPISTHQFAVNAGECSDPISFPGDRTSVGVTEVDLNGFTRLVSGPTSGLKVIASVFPGGTGNMTTVTFTNKTVAVAQVLGGGRVLA